MGLLEVHSQGINEAFNRQLLNPGPPPAPDSFSAWSFLASGAKGPVSGAIESGGTVADILSLFATPYAAIGGPGEDPKQTEEARQRMLKSQAFDPKVGDFLRKKADEFAPDPQTSTKADQVIHGLTRGVSKAVVDVLAMGPVGGAVAFGVDEGNTAGQRLRMEGVDPETAAKVGAVTGAIQGGTVAIPGVGSTVLKTLGLAAATGPVAFMAQEKLTKEILKNADYGDLASLHDPLDPLGLTLATVIPFAVGGLHIRNIKQRSLADVVQHIESGGQRFGPDGKLLTSPKGAQGEMQVMPGTATDPGFGVTPAKDNSPAELARVGREYLAAMQQRYGDTDKALAAYNAGPGAVDAAVKAHGEKWLDAMPAETKGYVAKANKLMGEYRVTEATKNPEVVDAARVKVTDEAMARSLPDTPTAHADVLRASDEIAAGRLPDVPYEPISLSHEVTDSYSGQTNAVITATRDGATAGTLEYSVFNGIPEISMVRVDEGSRRMGVGSELVRELQRMFPDQEIRWGMMTDEGSALRESLAKTTQDIPEIKAKQADLAAAVAERDQLLRKADEFQAIENPTPQQRQEAMAAIEPINALHDKIDGLERELSAAPTTKTLIDTAPREPRQRTAGRSETAPQNDLPLTDRPTLEPIGSKAAKAAEEEAGAVDQARLKQILEENPDMQVKLPGSDETVSMQEALLKAHEDFDAEMDFSELVKVAAECALMNGA